MNEIYPGKLYKGIREITVRVRYKCFDITLREFVWIPFECQNPDEYAQAMATLHRNRLLKELMGRTK